MKAKKVVTAATGVVIVLVVMLGLLSSPADAEKRRTYPSKSSFKLECELLGGAYSEYTSGALKGVSRCDWGGGGWTQCDENWSDPKNCIVVHEFIRPKRVRLSQSQGFKVAQVAGEPAGPRPQLDRRSVDDRRAVAH